MLQNLKLHLHLNGLKPNTHPLNFMVTQCINNIQHFNNQLTHTTLKNVVIQTF